MRLVKRQPTNQERGSKRNKTNKLCSAAGRGKAQASKGIKETYDLPILSKRWQWHCTDWTGAVKGNLPCLGITFPSADHTALKPKFKARVRYGSCFQPRPDMSAQVYPSRQRVVNPLFGRVEEAEATIDWIATDISSEVRVRIEGTGPGIGRARVRERQNVQKLLSTELFQKRKGEVKRAQEGER